jgi:hypothetical protein
MGPPSSASRRHWAAISRNILRRSSGVGARESASRSHSSARTRVSFGDILSVLAEIRVSVEKRWNCMNTILAISVTLHGY